MNTEMKKRDNMNLLCNKLKFIKDLAHVLTFLSVIFFFCFFFNYDGSEIKNTCKSIVTVSKKSDGCQMSK